MRQRNEVAIILGIIATLGPILEVQLARWGHEVVLFSEGTTHSPHTHTPTRPPGLSKVEYLRNQILDHTQILKLDLYDHTKVYK